MWQFRIICRLQLTTANIDEHASVSKSGTFGMIFRIECFLLLFWRTFCGDNFGQGRTWLFIGPATNGDIDLDWSCETFKVGFVLESHSIVFAPKISDQLGVSAKQGIIILKEGACKCLAEYDYASLFANLWNFVKDFIRGVTNSDQIMIRVN